MARIGLLIEQFAGDAERFPLVLADAAAKFKVRRVELVFSRADIFVEQLDEARHFFVIKRARQVVDRLGVVKRPRFFLVVPPLKSPEIGIAGPFRALMAGTGRSKPATSGSGPSGPFRPAPCRRARFFAARLGQ